MVLEQERVIVVAEQERSRRLKWEEREKILKEKISKRLKV
jgi:hypothetical protein